MKWSFFLAQRAALAGHPKRKKKQASKHLTYKIINISWTDRYLLDTMLIRKDLSKGRSFFLAQRRSPWPPGWGCKRKKKQASNRSPSARFNSKGPIVFFLRQGSFQRTSTLTKDNRSFGVEASRRRAKKSTQVKSFL